MQVDIGSMMMASAAQGKAMRSDLALCNAKSAQYGLALSEEQIRGLAERRVEALRSTGRVEFGRGVLVELVTAFCDSSFLSQETYDETLADLQDVFYQLKEDSDEQVPDQELIDAMRHAFDTEANGSTDYLGAMPTARFSEIARGARGDENEDWSEAEAYEEGESEHDAEKRSVRDELDRVYEASRFDRPDEGYAAGFYDGYNELYRIGFDANSRIGGSSMR